MVKGHGGTARPGPPGRVAAAPPTRSTKSPVQTPRTRTRNARTPTPGTPDVHTGQWTADRGHHMRGHWTFTRTPDTGRVDATEYSDRATSTRQAPDRHPGPPRPPDRPLGRRTVDLWTAPAAFGNDDGSATMRYLPARDYLQHYQAPAQSLCRPSRALAHCSPRWIRVERRANGEASSVMATGVRDRKQPSRLSEGEVGSDGVLPASN